MVAYTTRVVVVQERRGWISDILKLEPIGLANALDMCIGLLSQRLSACKILRDSNFDTTIMPCISHIQIFLPMISGECLESS